MADIVDAVTRSRMMAGIQAKNTKPELMVRKALHALGFRYALHSNRLPGKPDIVMPKWRVVIFVHGCFWHRHGCAFSKMPKGNAAFWQSKLAANVARDEAVKHQLTLAGWRTATVWECATRGKRATEQFPGLMDTLCSWIRDQAGSKTIELSAPVCQALAVSSSYES